MKIKSGYSLGILFSLACIIVVAVSFVAGQEARRFHDDYMIRNYETFIRSHAGCVLVSKRYGENNLVKGATFECIDGIELVWGDA